MVLVCLEMSNKLANVLTLCDFFEKAVYSTTLADEKLSAQNECLQKRLAVTKNGTQKERVYITQPGAGLALLQKRTT